MRIEDAGETYDLPFEGQSGDNGRFSVIDDFSDAYVGTTFGTHNFVIPDSGGKTFQQSYDQVIVNGAREYGLAGFTLFSGLNGSQVIGWTIYIDSDTDGNVDSGDTIVAQYRAHANGDTDLVGAVSHFAPYQTCLLYTSPSPRDRTRSRMPSSA